MIKEGDLVRKLVFCGYFGGERRYKPAGLGIVIDHVELVGGEEDEMPDYRVYWCKPYWNPNHWSNSDIVLLTNSASSIVKYKEEE